jgi:hypothetical protein
MHRIARGGDSCPAKRLQALFTNTDDSIAWNALGNHHGIRDAALQPQGIGSVPTTLTWSHPGPILSCVSEIPWSMVMSTLGFPSDTLVPAKVSGSSCFDRFPEKFHEKPISQ